MTSLAIKRPFYWLRLESDFFALGLYSSKNVTVSAMLARVVR
jgi:hypothetical protein